MDDRYPYYYIEKHMFYMQQIVIYDTLKNCNGKKIIKKKKKMQEKVTHYI